MTHPRAKSSFHIRKTILIFRNSLWALRGFLVEEHSVLSRQKAIGTYGISYIVIKVLTRATRVLV
jgi:hypothetical protein